MRTSGKPNVGRQWRTRRTLAIIVGGLVTAAGVMACKRATPQSIEGTPASANVLAPPVCEASAAVMSPWEPSTVLVADNEVHDRLFRFHLDRPEGTPQLTPAAPLAMPGDDRPRDIEALAVIGDELLIVGSHSRNRSCEHKRKRLRLRLVGTDDQGALTSVRAIDTAAHYRQAMASVGDCVATLFSDPAPPLSEAVCARLVAAESAADRGDREAGCETMEFEGATTLEGPSGPRVWLGLRRPLLGDRALILRLVEPLTELRFDRIASVALGGRGVRGLATRADDVLILAGPTTDRIQPFALWSAPVDGLLGEATAGLISDDLPTSSEGLVLTGGGRLLSFTDGQQGDDERSCLTASTYYEIR